MNNSEAREILGVSATASEHDVKQAFRRLALVVHPDRGGSSEAFIQINEAYEFLTGQRTAAAQSSTSGSTTKGSARANVNFGVATAAMTMLNLDPDEFIRIEHACYEWLGSVSQMNKRAAKQLLWLAVGRLPLGAAVSVVKGQRFKQVAKNMLSVLKDVNSTNGINSPSSWMNFAETYMQMLKLSGAKSASKEFNRKLFMEQLTKIEQSTRKQKPSGQY